MRRKKQREPEYRRLSFEERKAIEAGLNRKRSIRSIAAELERPPSTTAREIHRGREVANGAHKGEPALTARIRMSACPIRDSSPFCCNGCTSRHLKCRGKTTLVYRARSAHRSARARLVESRRGVDASPEEAEAMFAIIREDLARGLSPAQIAAVRGEALGRSASTIYRWVETGYGDMCNLDLRRKVGYKKRRASSGRRPGPHGPERSYGAFLDLAEPIREGAWEMDTVLGTKHDRSCLLTLLHRPTRFQLALPLEDKTAESVSGALDGLEAVLGRDGFERMLGTVLTGNGTEFADPCLLERSLANGRRCKVYYCDPRASNQKGACEKNHVEIRKLLPKGRGIRFDGLTRADCAHLMGQADSSPRPSLAGLSPVFMFKAAFKKEARALLEALGIEGLAPDELDLTEASLNKARDARGEEPLF